MHTGDMQEEFENIPNITKKKVASDFLSGYSTKKNEDTEIKKF